MSAVYHLTWIYFPEFLVVIYLYHMYDIVYRPNNVVFGECAFPPLTLHWRYQ